MRQFIFQHHRVFAKSRLTEGLIFLLLFLSGLARYRFVLVIVLKGLLSAANQYNITKDSESRAPEQETLQNILLNGLALIALMIDFKKGQIFPKYIDLSVWITGISVILGYGIALALQVKVGKLIEGFGKNKIFTVCPKCGFPSISVVEECKNCGFHVGIDLLDIEAIKEVAPVLKEEIEKNKKNHIYKKIPGSVIKGLALLPEEAILFSVKKPSMRLHTILRNGDRITINKYGRMCILNWVIGTNKRLCFLAEMYGGWNDVYCHTYDEVKGLKTENKILYAAGMDEVDKMTIETANNTYILRGPNPRKLYDAIASYVRRFSQPN